MDLARSRIQSFRLHLEFSGLKYVSSDESVKRLEQNYIISQLNWIHVTLQWKYEWFKINSVNNAHQK